MVAEYTAINNASHKEKTIDLCYRPSVCLSVCHTGRSREIPKGTYGAGAPNEKGNIRNFQPISRCIYENGARYD